MPTARYGKVRRLLRDKKAKVLKRCPFTIQLLYKVSNDTQDITLGVDAGSKYIGLSAVTDKKELYTAEIELRNDIVDLLSTRRENRRARRNRKTRYRKPRFENRKRGEGWLAPSVQNKVDTHLTVVRRVHEILPITKIIIEVAAFDIQKIKNPDIAGTEYQQGNSSVSGTCVNMSCSATGILASVAKENPKTRYSMCITSRAERRAVTLLTT